ncbi:antitermination protein NusB [Dyella jejuensis]|uniref:Antitermination protein NusB n=1 Tax=Dyella jejuensis TaxID=1432009 RepID=A0ABW8JH70_9GAMM
MLAESQAPWFVGWGTLALINAGLAQGKNRNGLWWFLLSLPFGPLATLVLVVLPKVRSRLF